MLIKTKNKIRVPPPVPFDLARRFAHLTKEEKYAFAKANFDDLKAFRVKYTWNCWARDEQLAPQTLWATWMIQAGRGFGKTRSGAEWVIEQAVADHEAHIALVGRTAADVRDVMVGGKSGILACSPPWFAPVYNPSKRRLTWPNGAMATTYTAEKSDQLRGPQHTKAWADERAAWQYDDTWDQLQFGLRLGANPQAVVTTTPRATKAILELVKDPMTYVTHGSTYDNTDNLSSKFLREIENKYGGTRLGRQEIEGAILSDIPGALWKRETMIERFRVREMPDLIRIVVAVDPSVKGPDEAKARNHELDEKVAETGIIVVGLAENGHAYVLADFSVQGKPSEWAEAVVKAYETWQADLVVGEINNGGDLVEVNIRTVKDDISYASVRASRGKIIRAEPVSSLYVQGKVHHYFTLPDLEDQLCNWQPGMRSPDRLDALVWGLTELMLDGEEGGGIVMLPAKEPEASSIYRPTLTTQWW